jgi:hypothetical protein
MPTSAEPDPYRLLGVQRGATDRQVAAAYRSLAKRLHPDLHGADAEASMRELNRAFRTLSDPARRQAWDAAHPVPLPAPVPAVGVMRSGGADASVPARAPAGTGGMRDSGWLALGVALAVLVIVLGLAWVASATPTVTSARAAFSRAGITAATSLALDPDHEVAVYKQTDGGLGVAAAERGADGWAARVLAEGAAAHPLAVLLYVDRGAGSEPLPPIAFGRAEGGVSEVRIAGQDGAVESANGTWLVAVPGITDPADLAWQFVLVDGSVVSGNGPYGG